jgi:hypothetical protein
MSMKNPLTPDGIEPATFRFVAQHINQCATAVAMALKTLSKLTIAWLDTCDKRNRLSNSNTCIHGHSFRFVTESEDAWPRIDLRYVAYPSLCSLHWPTRNLPVALHIYSWAYFLTCVKLREQLSRFFSSFVLWKITLKFVDISQIWS